MKQKESQPISPSPPEKLPFLLVIDDDNMVLDILNEVLQSSAIQIINAHTGREGLELFNALKDKVKIVLLDLFLPDLNGMEIYKTLIKIKPDIVILFMSGFPDQDILKLKDLPGKVDFIQKPFSIREIKSKIQKLMA
jgi:DNA-binding response OmpR family regulator